MYDRDKVLHGLNSCGYCDGIPNVCGVTECPYENDKPWCTHYLAHDAGELISELLKAQEPVKPVVDIDTWKCGNCGHTLEHQELLGNNVLFHEQYNYCPECGRKVKWE